jgi:hypothetical protein
MPQEDAMAEYEYRLIALFYPTVILTSPPENLPPSLSDEFEELMERFEEERKSYDGGGWSQPLSHQLTPSPGEARVLMTFLVRRRRRSQAAT